MQQIKIYSLGPSSAVKGGISRVVDRIRNRFPTHIDFQIIPTFSQYTGGGDEKGSPVQQLFVYAWACVRVTLAAIMPGRKVFHIQLSQRGSMFRKGTICLLLRLLRQRYIIHTHAFDDDLFFRWTPPSVKRAITVNLTHGKRFLVLTQSWRKFYIDSFGVSPAKVEIFPTPVELPAHIPDRRGRDGIRVLFLGRIGERKGAFELIRAFASLPEEIRSHSSLTLAGDGDIDMAKQLAKNLRCDSVSVPGWTGPTEVNRLLEESDIFVLASHGEGLSGALVEALAWGLAVITTAAGGTDEFLTTGQNALLVRPGNVEDIRDALAALITNEEFRLRLGQEARKTAEAFDVDVYIARLVKLYEDVADIDRIEGDR